MALNQPMDRLATANPHTAKPHTVNLPMVRPQLPHCTTSLLLLQAMDSQLLTVKTRATQQLPKAPIVLPATLPQAPMALPAKRATPQLLTHTVPPARRATHPLLAPNTEPVITLTPHLVNTMELQLPPTTLVMEAMVNSQAAMARTPDMEAQQPTDHMDHSSPLELSPAKQRELTVTLMYSTMDLALTSSSAKAMRPESMKRRARLALSLANTRPLTRPRSELWTLTKLRSLPKTLRCTKMRWI